MNFAYFPALILVGYKFLEDPFTSESQLNHPKMFKNQKYASPEVHSSIPVTLWAVAYLLGGLFILLLIATTGC